MTPDIACEVCGKPVVTGPCCSEGCRRAVALKQADVDRWRWQLRHAPERDRAWISESLRVAEECPPAEYLSR